MKTNSIKYKIVKWFEMNWGWFFTNGRKQDAWARHLRKKYKEKMFCNFDHNGECLTCDCWADSCAYIRYVNADYKWETREELEEMFKKDKDE